MACGAVEYTRQMWERRGWRTGTVNFGIPDLWTHMVVIVRSEDDWWVADPYLGNVWAVGLLEAISGIAAGRSPTLIDFGVTRDAHFDPGEDPMSSWVVGSRTPRPLSCREGALRTCTVTHELSDYASGNRSDEFLQVLIDAGLPGSLSSGITLAFGVNIDGRYREVEDTDGLIEILDRAGGA